MLKCTMQLQSAAMILYRVCKKMSQIQNRFKIGYLQNNRYQQQLAANTGHQMCI